MRWGPVLIGLVASTTASATPPARPSPAPRRPPPPDGLRDPFATRTPPLCDEVKVWSKVRACLERDHVRVSALYEVDGAKLVALVTEGAASTPLRLYVKSGEQWRQASFFGVNHASAELLAFKRIGDGRYRIDQGTVTKTSTFVGAPGTPQRVLLRRQLTTICTGTTCRSVFTACDALVDGKTYMSFHGTLHEEASALFVVGDKSRAGNQCSPVPSMFRSEAVGDPLE